MSYLVLFCSCIFSPFSIAITSLGEERANLSAFRTFVRFAWFCLFPLVCSICLVLPVSSSSWCLGRAAVCECGTRWTFLLRFSFFFFFFFFFFLVHMYILTNIHPTRDKLICTVDV